MAIPDGISKGVRKGVMMYVGHEFTLTFDRAFMASHRQEYLMFIELVKRLRNYRFDDRKIAWNIPLSEASAKLMIQLIGWGVQATKSATDALGVEMKRTAEVAAVKQAEEEEHVELDIPTAKDLAAALRNYQRAGVKFMGTVERFYNGDEMGLGKQQSLDAKILTPAGWTTMREIRVGDLVIGRNGRPTMVTGVFPQGVKPVYQVTFSDGGATESGPEHLWKVQSSWARETNPDRWEVLTLSQIMDRGIMRSRTSDPKKGYLWNVPLVQPVHFDRSDLPLHPYLLGYLLGNGNFSNGSVRVSFPDPETTENLRAVLPEGCTLVQTEKFYWDIAQTAALRRIDSNPVMAALTKLSLRGVKTKDKFVPREYMLGRPEDRLELLRGLMDSDGHAKATGLAEFDNESRHLISAVIELVRSLGGLATESDSPDLRGTEKCFRLKVTLPGEMVPFRLSRKADRYQPEVERRRKIKRSIVSIDYLGERECQCIAVAAQDHLYVTDDYIVTHNTAQVLGVLEMKRAFPAVILCPPKLKQNWLIECRKWLPHRRASVRHLDLAEITVIAYTEAHKFVNVGLVSTKKKERDAAAQDPKKWFFPTHARPVAVICDEAHQIKNRSSRRTMAALAIAKLCDCWIRGAMSGTPIENKHSEWLAPLEFLGVLDRLGGWHQFVTRYCGASYQKGLGVWDTSGSTNGRELYERLSQICYIRRAKKDHLKDLPDKIQQVQFVEIDNEAKYRQIERDVGAYLMSSNGGRMLTQGQTDAQSMIKLGLLRHACGVGKVAWVVEWIETFLESGEKFVVYAHHCEVMEALRIGLKAWNPAFIGGGCEDVTKEIEKFKTPTCRVMIASITGAGFGINGMQEVCSHIGILELMWTQTKHDQAVDRLHRIGQKDCVNAYYFIAEGTIDEDMWAVLCDKSRIFASTVDGEDDNKKTVLERIGAKFMHRAA